MIHEGANPWSSAKADKNDPNEDSNWLRPIHKSTSAFIMPQAKKGHEHFELSIYIVCFKLVARRFKLGHLQDRSPVLGRNREDFSYSVQNFLCWPQSMSRSTMRRMGQERWKKGYFVHSL
jgi:hypothetical protein